MNSRCGRAPDELSFDSILAPNDSIGQLLKIKNAVEPGYPDHTQADAGHDIGRKMHLEIDSGRSRQQSQNRPEDDCRADPLGAEMPAHKDDAHPKSRALRGMRTGKRMIGSNLTQMRK